MESKPFETFKSSLKDYFNQDVLSDLDVTCDGQIFKVHQLILCAHSKYFAKQLNGPWKVIKIEDFDIGVVEAMLHFMYHFDYTNSTDAPSMVFEAQVYQIADKYDVKSLKEHVKDKFDAAIAIGWPMGDFPLAITVAYITTPSEDRGLRDLIVKTSHYNINSLMKKGYFFEVLRNTADFAADLVTFLCAEGTPNVKRYRCPSCEEAFSCDQSSGSRYCPICGDERSDWAKFEVPKSSS
ncbi:hypothetical protein ACHAPT_011753 [Fusarium lateritium]